MKKFLLIYFLMLASAFPQGSRPPVTTLNGLDDVQVSSPSTGQILTYDSTTVPPVWRNVIPASVNFGDLNGVVITTPLDNQILKYNAAGFSWVNYGPLAFSDLTGNLAVTQLNNGTGASTKTYWRGDGTWGSPPTGTIPVTSQLLMGDGSGNAIDAQVNAGLGLAGNSLNWNVGGNFQTSVNAINGSTIGGFTNTSAAFVATAANVLTLETLGPFFATSGVFNAGDSRIVTNQGNLELVTSSPAAVIFSNNAGANERARFGTGLMIGTTIDKGSGTSNVSGGYYVNGNKIGGVATLSSSVDQTGTSETVHLSYTVPANTVQVGTTFRIFAWGNMDNPSSAITYTPRIRWGGTGGALLMATPAITSSTTAGTNRDWEINARVTVRSLGALAGTCVAMLHEANHIVQALPALVSDSATSGATAIGIDTTINRDICLTWTLSSPGGTPHVRTFGGVIEIVEP